MSTVATLLRLARMRRTAGASHLEALDLGRRSFRQSPHHATPPQR